mmetsp:Transcript_25529/g.73828  ORF Transcript_25529/g.73828 Transcript_25529/m.73828 type:complete len:431 (+) Transcript_25529:2-1294(+)
MQGNEASPADPATTTFLSGNPAWIGIGAFTGVLVGILKGYVFKFDDYKGFIDDLLTLESDPRESVKVAITCLVSLMGGASLGPESGLGSACGGMSKLWAVVVNKACRFVENKGRSSDNAETTSPAADENTEEEDVVESRRTKLIILAGMVAAFSTILPTPASTILLCLELPGFESLTKEHGLPYVKTVSQLTIAGTVSFLVFDHFYDNTYLATQRLLPGFLHQYATSDVFIGIFFGVLGAALALAYFVTAGITKGVTGKAKIYLDEKVGKERRIVLLATIGGTLFGLLGYIFPLTLGDGSYQIGTVIVGGGNISAAVLVSSAFVKMLTFWISNETGFVGGVFYPLLIIGSFIGRVFVNEIGWSWGSCMAPSLVALTSAFVPVPFGMMVLSMSVFNLSSRGGISTLLCVVTAHLLFAGIGIPQRMINKKTK